MTEQVRMKVVKFRVRPEEYQRLLRRAREGGYRQLAAYIRHKLLDPDRERWLEQLLLEIRREVMRDRLPQSADRPVEPERNVIVRAPARRRNQGGQRR